MWLFTTRGFYSAVRTPEGEVMVRGRVRADLEALVALMRRLELDPPQILATPHADYHYRVLMTPEAWARTAAALAAEVDYPNFKSRVHGDPERDRAYMSVWSAMHRLQSAKADQ